MRPWTITLGEQSWTDEDATVAHVAMLEEFLGIKGWEATSPWNSPVILAGWMVVLSSAGRTVEEATQEVYKLTVAQLAEALADR